MKIEIRPATISFSRNKTKCAFDHKFRRRIRFPSYRSTTDCKRNLNQFTKKKESRQFLLRAKCRWIENGERPTKFIFSQGLKKVITTTTKNIISKLLLQSNSITCNETVILERIENYNRNPYT